MSFLVPLRVSAPLGPPWTRSVVLIPHLLQPHCRHPRTSRAQSRSIARGEPQLTALQPAERTSCPAQPRAPATSNGMPRPSRAGQLSVVFAYSPALGSSLQCCFGDLQLQLPTISAPSPKLLLRAEAELMLSQCGPRHPHFPNLNFYTIETLIPTSMSSYYVPDAGEIITRGKMKSCMMVLFCSQTVQDRGPERLRRARNWWDQDKGCFK